MNYYVIKTEDGRLATVGFRSSNPDEKPVGYVCEAPHQAIEVLDVDEIKKKANVNPIKLENYQSAKTPVEKKIEIKQQKRQKLLSDLSAARSIAELKIIIKELL